MAHKRKETRSLFLLLSAKERKSLILILYRTIQADMPHSGLRQTDIVKEQMDNFFIPSTRHLCHSCEKTATRASENKSRAFYHRSISTIWAQTYLSQQMNIGPTLKRNFGVDFLESSRDTPRVWFLVFVVQGLDLLLLLRLAQFGWI